MKKSLNNKKRRVIILLFIIAISIGAIFIHETYSENMYPDAYHTYIERGYEETRVRNLVSAIYLNYRVFDTIFETLLLAISVTAVVYFAAPWEIHKKEDEDDS